MQYARVSDCECANYKKKNRGDWIRTSGPLHPMQVRYQAAPLPDQLQDSTAMVGVQDSRMHDMLSQNRKEKSK